MTYPPQNAEGYPPVGPITLGLASFCLGVVFYIAFRALVG